MMDVAAVRAHDKNPIMCSSCEDKLPAAARCIECMDFLCHDCRNAHMRLRLTKTHRVSAALSLLPWSFGLFSALLLNPLLTSVQTENIWRRNTIRHCLLIKDVDAELSHGPNSIKHVSWSVPTSKMFYSGWSNICRRSNFIKHGVQTWNSLVTKGQCLIVFDRQKFLVWTDIYQ